MILILMIALELLPIIQRHRTIAMCNNTVILQYRAEHKPVQAPGSDDYQGRLNKCLIAEGIDPNAK